MVIKLSTWNVNGLRTIKDLSQVLKDLDSDIVCLQETKLARLQVDDTLAFIEGYSSQFVFPRLVAGYSGCATYCRETARPFNAESGLNDESNCIESWKETLSIHDEYGSNKNLIKELDSEGRCLITCHHIKVDQEEECRKLYIFNVYFPRLDVDKVGRDEFKDKFNRLIELKANVFLQDPASHVIIAGDMNISHKPIDHCDPQPDFNDCIYKKWLTSLLSSDENDLRRHMIDSFRHLHPNAIEAFTCWNTQIRARATNFGTRIDYILVDSGLSKNIKQCSILSHYMGSDHCPVSLTLDNVEWVASSDYPSISTKLWPEFGCKKQMRLTSFFSKTNNQPLTQIMPATSPPKKAAASQKLLDPSPKKTKAITKNSSRNKKQSSNHVNNQTSIKNFMLISNKKNEKEEEELSQEPKQDEKIKVEFEKKDDDDRMCVLEDCKMDVEHSVADDSSNTVEYYQNAVDSQIIERGIQGNSDDSGDSKDSKVIRSSESRSVKSKSPKVKSKEKPKVSLFDKIMAGPPKPPLCSGHKVPCVMNTCNKQGPNYRKRFWSCALPKGDPNKPLITSCKYFRWIS